LSGVHEPDTAVYTRRREELIDEGSGSLAVTTSIPASMMLRLLIRPRSVFRLLADADPAPLVVFFKFALWLGLLPPLFAYIGASTFGWRVGVVEPLFLPQPTLIAISIAYFCSLLFGFFSASIISRWMAVTYGARDSLGVHLAMMVIVGAPLAIASLMHLYPNALLNAVVFVPTMIWSMYLLYRGLPTILHTTPEQGMLMASSIIGYLLVAAVSLLGLTVFLWVMGIGPALGV
jgi:hypothetical protein